MEVVSVSLLPPEFKQVSVVQRRQQRIFLGFAVVCAVLLVAVVILAISVQVTRGELESTLAYRQVLEKQIAALAPYEEAYNELMNLNSIIEEITAGQVDWTNVMLELGRYIPQGVWLTDLRGSVEKGSSRGDLVLRGQAKDHLWVSRFLAELRTIPSLADIKCRFSTGDGLELTQFEISGSIVPLTGDER